MGIAGSWRIDLVSLSGKICSLLFFAFAGSANRSGYALSQLWRDVIALQWIQPEQTERKVQHEAKAYRAV
jgi:hypothetical protein